jgi:hypothetical protein
MTSQPDADKLAAVPKSGLNADWREVLVNAPPLILTTVGEVVDTHRAALATDFYTAMMADAEATAFLSHAASSFPAARLHPALDGHAVRW